MADSWPQITATPAPGGYLALITELGEIYQGRGETEDAACKHVAWA